METRMILQKKASANGLYRCHHHRLGGFTLLELMISLLIATIIISMVSMVMINANAVYFRKKNKVDISSIGNNAVFMLSREIANTGLKTCLYTNGGGEVADTLIPGVTINSSDSSSFALHSGLPHDSLRLLRIAVDDTGSAYVAGKTTSADDFPTTSGAYDTMHNGGLSDAFVAKFNPAGSALDYSTFIGGDGTDMGWGIAVDWSRNACFTGYTESTDFPTTAGAVNTASGGDKDVFVAALNNTGKVA